MCIGIRTGQQDPCSTSTPTALHGPQRLCPYALVAMAKYILRNSPDIFCRVSLLQAVLLLLALPRLSPTPKLPHTDSHVKSPD